MVRKTKEYSEAKVLVKPTEANVQGTKIGGATHKVGITKNLHLLPGSDLLPFGGLVILRRLLLSPLLQSLGHLNSPPKKKKKEEDIEVSQASHTEERERTCPNLLGLQQ